jgi:hypothetical protein
MNKTLTIVVKTAEGDVYLSLADTELINASIMQGRRSKSLNVKKFELCDYPYAEIEAVAVKEPK